MNIFEQVGGEESLELVVEQFYKKVENDNRVNHFFENINMKRQKKQQVAFLKFIMGGSDEFKGKDMKKAHKELNDNQGLNESHYDVIVEILANTLKEFKVPSQIIDKINKSIEPYKNDILGR